MPLSERVSTRRAGPKRRRLALMDMNTTRTTALAALLMHAGGAGSARSDLCPAPLWEGTMTIPDTSTQQLEAATHGGDATLSGALGVISRPARSHISWPQHAACSRNEKF